MHLEKEGHSKEVKCDAGSEIIAQLVKYVKSLHTKGRIGALLGGESLPVMKLLGKTNAGDAENLTTFRGIVLVLSADLEEHLPKLLPRQEVLQLPLLQIRETSNSRVCRANLG